ncbi:copper-translocating P-type ATPase [Fictibacillus sp. 5RED26]|nr:copper-translocating P-type ATPase [Fictibacillus sp. 7GRE50]MBH0157195.1 copper-translocating P-type ATPase [Fictibacillus sp. 5RED26]MBH0159516.1 copper-translocating P-type ATPase [Fictibacillus sp. 26RED30]MBH0169689.1 copper-translocating P-type ATPase [Fictibacillus sp. 18YEL24]MBH0174189.1 copper-translocating P-type ATPase [Fictibacillus sp. 23RED33]MBH0163684.1 copper-translocating P-type ATPase [Fictibacillus sp. 7GRE50]
MNEHHTEENKQQHNHSLGNHTNQEDHNGHHDHMIDDFKKRFYISLLLTIPILILSPMIQMFFGFNITFPSSMLVLFTLSTVVFFYGGWPFISGLIDEIKQKNPGMMTLIGLAIISAYIYSTLTVFGYEGENFFWELATLVDIMLLGHWIEMKSIMKASNSLEALIKLMPQEAHLIQENGDVMDVSVSELKKHDKILIKPGEKVPADGVVIKGVSNVNESMLTGESVPVEKEKDHNIIAGSINGEGSLTILIKNIGEETYLSQVIKLVQDAQATKSKTQALSDRAAKWLFYIALCASLTTLIIWLLLGYDFYIALERMVTVLVISCPHALGLAVPLVIARSTTLSAKNGLLIRNRTSFEDARNLDSIVFDKTGTLTKGEFGVTDIITEANKDENDLLQLAASIESQSEHPIAKGIVEEANKRNIKLLEVEEFKSITGKGLQGIIKSKAVKVMSPRYVIEESIAFDSTTYKKLSNEGKTVSFILINDELYGMIALADQVKDTAYRAIEKLKEKNIRTIMLTGDNQQVANWVGKKLKLDEIFSEVLPHQKADQIKKIKSSGQKVAMTGDGVNDAPALASADLGIAIGAGTDVAMETADIILARSNPEDVVSIIDLSRATYKKMLQNLWWAAGYNIFALPLAAGILYPYGILLDPAVGAVLMSLSTIIVAINAQLLKI